MLPPVSLLSSWGGQRKKCGVSGAQPVGFVVQIIESPSHTGLLGGGKVEMGRWTFVADVPYLLLH